MYLYVRDGDLCLVYDPAAPAIARLPLKDLAEALAPFLAPPGRTCPVCGRTMDSPNDTCLCEILAP